MRFSVTPTRNAHSPPRITPGIGEQEKGIPAAAVHDLQVDAQPPPHQLANGGRSPAEEETGSPISHLATAADARPPR